MRAHNEPFCKCKYQSLSNKLYVFCYCIQQVEDDLENVKNASSQSELLDNFRLFGKNTNDLTNQAAKRQNELKDPRLRDDLASARAVLKKNSMMLLTASKVIECPMFSFIRHLL